MEVLETLPCGGIFSAKIGQYCGVFQDGVRSFLWRMRGKGSKSRAIGMFCPIFILGGLCRVDGASILIFLNVEDDLKCGVIFRHYLEV